MLVDRNFERRGRITRLSVACNVAVARGHDAHESFRVDEVHDPTREDLAGRRASDILVKVGRWRDASDAS